MKKIIFLLLSLLICSLFSSCNTTKRAEKRIYNIVENHQELLKQDTVKIDTVLSIKPAADSVIFAFDDVAENEIDTIFTNGGCFSIQRLPSQQIKVVYSPEPFKVRYRDNIIREKIVIEEPQKRWRNVLFYVIVGFVGLLFLKMFFERIMK